MSDYISAEIAQEVVNQIMNDFADIQAKMPFIINLSPSVKKTMPKLEDSRSPFVSKCIYYARNEPKILPPFTDLDELERDINLFNNLQNIAKEVNRLADMINDTRIAAGSDAYVAALSIYNSAKQAAKMNIPGTKPIVDDLKKAFENISTSRTDEVVKPN
ncbi:hypothetical protein CYCD_13150 [Tenuifilaceae bacterium CYCD]|nr:hypothetical protein CYCD_13150 [Tenuifilaceae bacterium CYCD]